MRFRALLLCFCITVTAVAQQTTVFEDRAALVLSNDKIALTVLNEGGAMAQIVLADDKEKINPLWNPYWIARQAGQNRPASFARGHFVCIDGFGPVSAEERAAGLTAHGEAYTLPWQLQSHQKQGNTLSAAYLRRTADRAGNVHADVSRRRRREHRVGRQLSDEPAGIRSPRFLGRARDGQRAVPRAGQSRGRYARRRNRRRRRISCSRTPRGSCGRSSTSPGRTRRPLTARRSTCARRR